MGNNVSALVQRAERELEQLRAQAASEGSSALATDVDFVTGLEEVAGLPFEADEEVVEEVAEATVAPTVEFVTLKVKRSWSKRLVNAIHASNPEVDIEEADDAYVLTGAYIKITRAEVESVTGRLTDTRWRMLFMNRTGEIREFNNYEFAMGVPRQVVTEAVERRESTQINVRIPTDLKALMEELRAPEILDLSQNEFVAEALSEYIAMIKKERI